MKAHSRIKENPRGSVNAVRKTLVALALIGIATFGLATAQAAPTSPQGPLLIFADPMRPIDYDGNTHVTDHFNEGGISATRIGATNVTEDWFSIPNYADTHQGATVWYITDFTLDTAHNKMYWVDYYGVNVGTIGGCKGARTCGKLLYSASDLNTSNGYEYTTGIAIDPASQTLYVGVYNNTNREYEIKKMSSTHNISSISVVPSAAHIPNGNGIGSIVIYQDRLYWTQGTNAAETTGVMWGSIDSEAGGAIATGADVSTLTAGIWGLAIDRAHRKVYYANWTGATRAPWGTVGVAELDGSDAGFALTADSCGAILANDEFLSGPNGIAYDYHDESVTWGNWNWNSEGNPGKARVNTGGYGTRCQFIEVNQNIKYDGNQPISFGQQSAVAYLYKPEFSSTPQVRFRTRSHTSLTCNAAFDGDRGEAHMFMAATTTKYSWTLNGKKIAGTSSNLRANKAGSYKCTVTGSNYSGSTSATSPAITVTKSQAK
jgi:hypothetical protein